MQTPHVSRDDMNGRSAADTRVGPHAGTHPATTFPSGGLFSHPDMDHLDTRPGSSPDEDQRSYTGLFREPADAPQDTGEQA
jgi:hypothetical protein